MRACHVNLRICQCLAGFGGTSNYVGAAGLLLSGLRLAVPRPFLVVLHVRRGGAELLVALDDLVDGVQEVLLGDLRRAIKGNKRGLKKAEQRGRSPLPPRMTSLRPTNRRTTTPVPEDLFPALESGE